jgi:hypothetical protein
MINAPDAFEDCLKHHQRTIDQAVGDLRLSLRSIGIRCATTLLGLSVPSWASGLASVLPANAPLIKVAGAVCMAAGVIVREGVNYYRSWRTSPWSYVLSLERGLDSRSFIRRLL